MMTQQEKCNNQGVCTRHQKQKVSQVSSAGMQGRQQGQARETKSYFEQDLCWKISKDMSENVLSREESMKTGKQEQMCSHIWWLCTTLVWWWRKEEKEELGLARYAKASLECVGLTLSF